MLTTWQVETIVAWRNPAKPDQTFQFRGVASVSTRGFRVDCICSSDHPDNCPCFDFWCEGYVVT